jgi:hypothetical protein
MPLKFSSIYVLSDVNQNFIKVQQIAMAPRVVKVKNPITGDAQEEWQFLVPSEVSMGHTVLGEVVSDTDSTVDIEDKGRIGDDGNPILWRFEPLTLAAWNAMGERGDIDGWEVLTKNLHTDEELLRFYNYDWLLPRLEWWKETLGDPTAA